MVWKKLKGEDDLLLNLPELTFVQIVVWKKLNGEEEALANFKKLNKMS